MIRMMAFYLLVLSSIFVFIAKCDDSLQFVENHDHNSHAVHLNDLQYSMEKANVPPLKRMVLVIDVSTSLHITLPHYISLNIDSNQIRYKLKGFDFR